jgi:uridylate kinase
LFGRFAHPEVIVDPTKKVNFKKDVLIAAGWKPGWSTDYDSVLLAKNLGARTIINLTNVDHVYDRDPRKYPNAKAFKRLSWPEFKRIVGGKWSPGLSMPFDPIASKLASRLGMRIIIMNGNKLQNLENFLNKKSFTGTTIG